MALGIESRNDALVAQSGTRRPHPRIFEPTGHTVSHLASARHITVSMTNRTGRVEVIKSVPPALDRV
jgi:hypothetical protein